MVHAARLYKSKKRENGDNIEFIISHNSTNMVMFFRYLHVQYIPPYELNPAITSDFEEIKSVGSWAPYNV